MSRKKHQDLSKLVYRSTKTPLAEQIRNGISTAIESGVLASGARLSSWQDLAAQLGVARGTASGNINVQCLYLGGAAAGGENVNFLCETGPIARDETGIVTLVCNRPPSRRMWTISAVINWRNEVREYDEMNNEAGVTMTAM